MKKTLILVFLVTTFVIFSSSIRYSGSTFVAGEVLVKFKTSTSMSAANSAVAAIGAERMKSLPQINVLQLKLKSDMKVSDAINELVKLSTVVYAEPNYIYRSIVTPNDRNFTSQWALHNTGQTGGVEDADIDAPEAWDISTGSQSVLIGVIDTGVDYAHEDLANNIWTNPGEDAWADPKNPSTGNGVDDDNNGKIDDWKGWNFITNTNDAMDDNSHGTHCAGILGAEGQNGTGIAGVNWQASILPLKFLDSDGSGTVAAGAEAILYAIEMGAFVLSNSWGGTDESSVLRDAIVAADDAGVLFVAACGNDGLNTDVYPHYPSGYDLSNIISVASSDDQDMRSVWGGGGGGDTGCGECGLVMYDTVKPHATPGSNYGSTTVDLAAPGSGIYSTIPGGYDAYSGTSMATPFVAGVAALVKANSPGKSHLEVKQTILQSVDHLVDFEGKSVTEGRLNAYNALASGGALSSR